MEQMRFEGNVAKMFILAVLASKGTPLVDRAFILVASELGYTLTPTDLEPVLFELELSGAVRRDVSSRVSGAFATSVQTWELIPAVG